jgi:hypothetical protein
MVGCAFVSQGHEGGGGLAQEREERVLVGISAGNCIQVTYGIVVSGKVLVDKRTRM